MKLQPPTKPKQAIRMAFIAFLWFSATALMAQQGTITGKVTDTDGNPLIGANVVLAGTTTGTVTDLDGKFTLSNVPAGDFNLNVSFVGYLQETVAVSLKSGETKNITVKLAENLEQLSEVVVIGYGSVKKNDLTGAVASVKPEDITKLPTTNINKALEGHVAGVMVTSSSGAPGSDPVVRIRGISTVNNSDPLYVVDGFPTGNISYINPSDIESMEVLKDASATAIYGNRGSNGVILITTKKGKNQKSTVTFNSYVGIQKVIRTIPVLNAVEYAKAKYEAYDNASIIKNNPNLMLTGSGSALDDTLQWVLNNNYPGTNWQDQIFRTGLTQNYELGINGGSDKYSYNVSGSFNRDDGIVIDTWQKRYILRYAGQAKVNKYIKTDFSMAYRHTEGPVYNTDIYGQGVIPNALVGDPISLVYLPDTNWYAPVDISNTSNPVAAADRLNNNNNKIDNFVGNFGTDITIIKGLVFSSKFGADLEWNKNKTFLPNYVIGLMDRNDPSYLDETYVRNFGWNNSNYLNYNKDFGKSSLNLMIGQEWSAYKHNRLRYRIYYIPDNPNLEYPEFSNPDATIANPLTPIFNFDFSTQNRPAYETTLFSYFGRIFYGYDNRYLLTANFRRDASSKFSKENRWGSFPSISLGWNIKNENFLKNVGAISALKFRFGWGKTGNQGSLYDPYAQYAVVTSTNLDMIGQNDQPLTGAIQTVNPNPNLRWEVVKQSNIAADFGFLGNRLTGSIDFYTKHTTDMIIVIPPPYFSGSDVSQGNYGKLENKGIELTLNYRNFDREFKYEIGGNFTWQKKPMITQWADPTYAGSVTKIQNINRTAKDEEMAHFYGYKTNGLLSQSDIDNTYTVTNGDTNFTYAKFWAGQIKLVDLNGDGVINQDDKTNIGSPNPDFFYGLNINLMYKGFDLLVFFQGVYGNKLINGLNAWSKFPDEGNNNLSTEVLDAWRPDHQNTSVPRLVQGNGIMQSNFNDYLVENASYLRLKNIQLGYTIPNKITQKIGITTLRIYITGEDILTLTKYSGFDPEVGSVQYDNSLGGNNPLTRGIDQGNYPTAKKYLVGLNVTF